MSLPIPVILCGQTLQIAEAVIQALKPEIEVIHLILTPSSGITQIPPLLQGSKSVPSDSHLGSKNYTKPPVAIILGGGYEDADIEALREAAKGSGNVPWLRPDKTKNTLPPGPEYGRMLVVRIKEVMRGLSEGGMLGVDGVVWY